MSHRSTALPDKHLLERWYGFIHASTSSSRFSSVGICSETSSTAFTCLCPPAWKGTHCETTLDACANITCQNNGVCRPSLLHYTCQCLGTSYSGRHCEIKSKATAVLQAVSRSFAFVAIIAMVTLALLIVLLDVLKYCFNVNKDIRPIRRKKQPHTMVRFIYVNPSNVP